MINGRNGGGDEDKKEGSRARNGGKDRDDGQVSPLAKEFHRYKLADRLPEFRTVHIPYETPIPQLLGTATAALGFARSTQDAARRRVG